tara:strand:+ start:1211 stop:2053 length:843 start_codon:yes stop_codon:yes gene_type:complete
MAQNCINFYITGSSAPYDVYLCESGCTNCVYSGTTSVGDVYGNVCFPLCVPCGEQYCIKTVSVPHPECVNCDCFSGGCCITATTVFGGTGCTYNPYNVTVQGVLSPQSTSGNTNLIGRAVNGPGLTAGKYYKTDMYGTVQIISATTDNTGPFFKFTDLTPYDTACESNTAYCLQSVCLSGVSTTAGTFSDHVISTGFTLEYSYPFSSYSSSGLTKEDYWQSHLKYSLLATGVYGWEVYASSTSGTTFTPVRLLTGATLVGTYVATYSGITNGVTYSGACS